jgi:hypothetical protein
MLWMQVVFRVFACLHIDGAGDKVGEAIPIDRRYWLGDIMSEQKGRLSRRTVFAGAGAIGAIAAAATALPRVVQQTEAAPASSPPPEKGGGYRLTDHVKRYYKSTLV